MKPYFAYGSNLWREQMRCRCPDHRIVGRGSVKGYRWIISTRGYATIVKSEGDEVHGVIYEISESDECRLDRCEGVDCGAYRKQTILVEFEGRHRECLVYVDAVEQEGMAKNEYIERVNKGLSDSELPSEYVSCCVRKFIPGSAEES
jgi:gamma-glutamylcyclotransferase